MSGAYTIMNALDKYAVDNKGDFPSGITTNEQEICVTGAPLCDLMYDLSVLTDNEKYLVSIPIDPLCPDLEEGQCQENGTGYQLSKTANGRMHIVGQGENDGIDTTR